MLAAVLPSAGVLLLFVLAVRAMVHADRRERAEAARFEARASSADARSTDARSTDTPSDEQPPLNG